MDDFDRQRAELDKSFKRTDFMVNFMFGFVILVFVGIISSYVLFFLYPEMLAAKIGTFIHVLTTHAING